MNKTTIVENQSKDSTNGKPNKRIKEDRPRKKDDKSVDHVLRALDSLGTTEEKLGAMCQKYAEMFNDHRMLQSAVKQAERKNTVLQKEKEQLQAEHSKAILTRSRLENLCRELQRQNKAVKEECMLKMREEGEKKREVAAKFHSMLSEIGSLLAQNNDKNAKLRDDNLDMSMRLKSVCDQFEKKEQHVENLAKQMQLEMQLADAKLAKAKMEMDIEKETLQKEKQQLLIELSEYKRKLCEMKASELALREQITMYSEKYEEFHKALLQSNTAIGEFKAEMERMTKHIRRLEKETAVWKTRYDAAQRTLAEMTQGKLRSDEALGLSQRRLTALQGICRGLQDQCRQLRGETRRDSQTDEDYKRLEAQIKEVERADSEFNGTSSPTSATPDVEASNETVSPPIVDAVSLENENKSLATSTTDTTSLSENETESPATMGTDESSENKESINENKLSNDKHNTEKEVTEEIKSDENIIKKEQNETEKEHILEESESERCSEVINDDKIDTGEEEKIPNMVADAEQPYSVKCDCPADARQEINFGVLQPHPLLTLLNSSEETTALSFDSLSDKLEEKFAIEAIINHLQEVSLLHEKGYEELTKGDRNLPMLNEKILDKNDCIDSENEKVVPNSLCTDNEQSNGISSTTDEPVQADAIETLTIGSDVDCNSILFNSDSAVKSPKDIEEISNIQQANETSNEHNTLSHQDVNKVTNTMEEVNQSKNKRKRKNRK